MISFFLLCTTAMAEDALVISGELTQGAPGPVRIEVLVSQGAGRHPLLLAETVRESPGPYRLSVPTGHARAQVRAGLDRDLDGIGPRDLQLLAPIPILLDRAEITGVDIDIPGPPANASD